MISALMRKELSYDFAVRATILSLAFLVSLAGLIFGIHPALVVAFSGLGYLLILSATGGETSLFEGARKYSGFVEYLPIRRSQLWLANFLYEGAYFFILLLFLLWSQVVFFDAGDYEFAPLSFDSRWQLVSGIAAMGFWIYAVRVFLLCFSEMPTTARFSVALVPILILVAHLWGLIFVLHLLPSLPELAPVCLVSGLSLAGGGLLVFVLRGTRVRLWKRAVFCVGPLFIFLLVLGEGCLYHGCLQWKEFDFNDKANILGIRLLEVGESDRAILLADVDSARSSWHWISIDSQTMQVHHLGRRLYLASRKTFFDGSADRLWFCSRRAPDTLFPDDEYLIMVDIDGRNQRRVVRTSDYHTGWAGVGPPFPRSYGMKVGDFDWDLAGCFPDEGLLAFAEVHYLGSEEGLESSVVLTDMEGQVRKRVLRHRPEHSVVCGDGVILALAPSETPGEEHEPGDEQRYLLIDARNLSVRRLDLPGIVLTVSRNARRAQCALQRIEEGKRYYSVALVEIPSLEQRNLIAEDELPVVEILEPLRRRSWPQLIVAERPSTSDLDIPLSLYIDPDFTFAVWVRKHVSGSFFGFSITLIDLSTSEKRVIVPSTELPQVPVLAEGYDKGGTPYVYGLTPSDDGVVYGVQEKIFMKPFDGGEAALVADLGAGTPVGQIGDAIVSALGPVLSPDMRRAFRQVHESKASDRWRVPRARTTSVEVIEGRESRIIFKSDALVYGDPLWVDDERIAIPDGGKIFLVNADGTGRTRLFPPAREVSHQ